MPDHETPTNLRAGHRPAPLGLPVRATHLSWAPTSAVPYTVAVQDAAGNEIWTTTTTRPSASVPGDVLESRGRYAWTVWSPGSKPASAVFELGLEDETQWSAKWTQAPAHRFASESFDPVPYLRRSFDVASTAGRNRLYITALGLYRVWLNGVELTSDELLRPGWTDYAVRVHHQTFDCDGILREGENVLAVTLAKGWYAGRLGLLRQPGYYGTHPALLAQLDQIDPIGQATTLCTTDSDWKTAPGAILCSDLLRGETVDLRQEPTGWRDSAFDDNSWAAVQVNSQISAHVVAQPHDSIRVFREHEGTLVHEHARGPMVFDFGQNLVGWTRISSPLIPRTDVIVRHGEILTKDNLVWRDNLRGAFQEDTFVDDSDGIQTLEPSFTSHGFRYAEVWGLPSQDPFGATKIHPDTSITAISIEAGHDRAGTFTSSDSRVNALADAIEWTVRDNFLEVATDCPQRDERHGWLGDAGVIAPTAAFFFDTAAFMDKFATDAADDQGDDGEIRSYVPVIPPAHNRPGAPGWADGYVRLVHLLVERYGDLTAAERHAPSMIKFAEHILRHNPDGLRVNAVGADFADWLSLPEYDDEEVHPGYAYTGAFSTAPKPVVGTAHTYRTFIQLSQVLARLGRDQEAQRWADEAARVREVYRSTFLRSDLTVDKATQTVYAQAIGYGLVDDSEARDMASLLRSHIEKRGHVTTGIHGVEHLLGALARNGHREFATEVLLRDDMPSWLYMVGAGGTTIWEKWDGIRPDGSLSTAEMNSFNHCALGAVGIYLFEDLLGLRPGDGVWTSQVGIAASYTRDLDWVEGSYDSPVGQMRSRWEWEADQVVHAITVPRGSTGQFSTPEGFALLSIDGEQAPAGAPGPVEITAGEHRIILAEGSRP